MADAKEVAPHLRRADLQECMAFAGVPPSLLLPLIVQGPGKSWVALSDEGEVIALFGVDPVAGYSQSGIVWMVSTPAISEHRKYFIRETPKWLTRLHAEFPLLGNYIDSRNTEHIRWLNKMGFRFIRKRPRFGAEQREFLEFARIKEPKPCA